MKKLTSMHNPLIKRALSLHRAGHWADAGEILIEGETLIREAIRSGVRLNFIFVSENHEHIWKEYDKKVIIVPSSFLSKLSRLDTPPSAVALAATPIHPKMEDVLFEYDTLIVLDRVQNPGNVGTIIRTLDAFGRSALIMLKGCASPNNPKVIRAAMGSTFRVPIITDIDGLTLLTHLHQHGFYCYATSREGNDLRKVQFPNKIAIFLGSEGSGLAPDIKEACDNCLSIPMQVQVDSFNVAIATSIILYERFRNVLP